MIRGDFRSVWWTLLWHQVADGAATFQALLHLRKELDTVDNTLAELELGVAKTVSVGDIENARVVHLVNTAGSTLLEAELLQDVVELGVLGQVGDLDVDTRADTR